MCRSLCSPNSWWRWSLCWVRCLCPWSWTTWAASTRLKAWRARPMPRCAGCSTAATPGSSSPAPICVHRWAALPMPTRCRWAAIWCAPRPSAWSGAATGRTPPRRRAPSTMPTWWTCCRPGRARTRPWTASWWTTPQGCMASTARPDTPRKTDTMFLLQAPQVCELESFTTMPDALRHPERSDWADANRSGAVTDSFLEGPVFDAAGHLYVADIPWGRVFRIDPQGAWTLVAEYDGEPNGMKFLDERTLLITDYKNGLMRLEVATGRISPYLQRRNSERFKGVNDLVFDAEGNLDFTAPPLVQEAAARAVQDGATQYTPALGLPQLRERISHWYAQRFGVDVPARRIVVTAGASAALQLACLATIDAGDEILMPDPSYPCNRHFVSAAEGRAVMVPTTAAERYQLSADKVEAAWTEHTRGVLLASPSNPTGTSIPPA